MPRQRTTVHLTWSPRVIWPTDKNWDPFTAVLIVAVGIPPGDARSVSRHALSRSLVFYVPFLFGHGAWERRSHRIWRIFSVFFQNCPSDDREIYARGTLLTRVFWSLEDFSFFTGVSLPPGCCMYISLAPTLSPLGSFPCTVYMRNVVQRHFCGVYLRPTLTIVWWIESLPYSF